MGRYLDIADAIPRAKPEPARQDASATVSTDLKRPENEADSENVRKLLEAGWAPKASYFEHVIWERPETGFYYSEEMALHLLDAKNIRDKSGANTRR